MLMLNPSSIIKELDDMFTAYTHSLNETAAPNTLLKGTAFSEDETTYVCYYDLPGYDKTNITVEVDTTTRYITVKADPPSAVSSHTTFIYNDLSNKRKYTHKTKLVGYADMSTPPQVLYSDGVLKVVFNKLTSKSRDTNVLKLTPE